MITDSPPGDTDDAVRCDFTALSVVMAACSGTFLGRLRR